MGRWTRGPARAASRAVALAVCLGGLAISACDRGEGGGAPGEALGDAASRPTGDAAPPPARALEPLGPSGLEAIEVLTGGASATEPLPLVLALHDGGEEPEGLAKLLEGIDGKARVVLPRGPVKQEKGLVWLVAGPDEVVSRAVTRAADAVAALGDEVAARTATEGRPVVTGIGQGGLVAFVSAVRHPERAAAVVPVNASLPQAFWPEEGRLGRDRPIVRALAGASDEDGEATEVRRAIVKLRMLRLDATVRLYAETGRVLSPAITTDLLRTLGSLVASADGPPSCEACPGASMDPEACSLCPAGPPAAEPEPAPRGSRPAPAAPAPSAGEGHGPDLSLDRDRVDSVPDRGGGGGGGLSREQIQATFRRNMAPIRFCHEHELGRRPGLSGRVVVRLVVAPDGAVSSAEVASSTLGDATVEECVRRAVSRLRFPSPEGGAATTVTYPFTFTASGP